MLSRGHLTAGQGMIALSFALCSEKRRVGMGRTYVFAGRVPRPVDGAEQSGSKRSSVWIEGSLWFERERGLLSARVAQSLDAHVPGTGREQHDVARGNTGQTRKEVALLHD